MLFTLASHYGGGLPYEFIMHHMSMTEVEIAVRVMNQERKQEAQRYS